MRKILKQTLLGKLQSEIQLKVAKGLGYETLSKIQKNNLRKLLLASQKHLCCYCEKRIDKMDLHIEHFFEQDSVEGSGRTLDYEHNLLASCTKMPPKREADETEQAAQERFDKLSCGHKKAPPYHENTLVDYALLLNPMKTISHFFSYIDGMIAAHDHCDSVDIQRVNYTIRRLALDNAVLTDHRIKALTELAVLLEPLSVEEQKVYLRTILDETNDELNAYFSTLKDNFSYILEL